MKVALVLLFIGAAVASELSYTYDEKVRDVKDKQYDINALYIGLGSEQLYDYVPKDFPYTEPKYYREPAAVEKFMTAWKEGFIPKSSYFSLYSYKNRHDTYRFFDVLYFAKDYDTFYKIAKWGRSELHPLQFAYAFTASLFHREDTKGIAIPHLYEVFPQYYVPAEIVQGAYKAYILGVNSRKFDVNSTGYEYNWYKGQTFESYKSGPKWNVYDDESRMNYYTEDAGLGDFMTKTVMAFAPWISEEKYPDIYSEKKGEILFEFYKYILKRYNLERYGNGLPPVQPINYKDQIKTGYHPHLVNIHGHPFTSRPDGFVPYASNYEGIDNLFNTHRRFDDLADIMGFWNPMNQSYVYIEDDVKGVDTVGQLVYGVTHPHIRAVYKPIHYQALEALDTGVRSSNDVAVTGSVLSHYLTEMRDPVYYRVLATVHKVFENYFNKLPPYTRKELEFPGVKVTDFQTSKLETYFENFEYDITNAVPFKQGFNSHSYEYSVAKTRINHKPFTFKFNIQSDKQQDAIFRVFFTPSFDANGRPLTVAEKLHEAVGAYVYRIKLKEGTNTFEESGSHGFYAKENSLRNITEALKQAKSEHQPYFIPSVERCSVPCNLILPRGYKGGKQYSVFVMVHPYIPTGEEKTTNPCGWDVLTSSNYPVDFPTNRRVIPSYFENLDNIYFKDVYIYHNDQQY